MSRLEELIAELCPNGVEYRTLGELGSFYGGLTGKSKEDFTNGNAKFITYMNIFKNIAVNTEIYDLVKVGESERQNSIKYGDILFTGSSETPEECGMSSVLTEETDELLYLNSFSFGFRLNEREKLLPHFLKYLFRSSELRREIRKTASGVTRFNVSKKKMEQISIPLPPLPVQEEIVRILDNFTELSNELSAELSARKKQYEYYHKFLLSFSDDVEWITLGEIGPVRMCKRIMKSETSSTGDVPFFKIGTFGREPDAFITQEKYEEYKNAYSFPKKGDILISAAGTIGRTVIYDGEPAYYQDSNIVWIDNNENRVLNKYLIYCYAMKPWAVSNGGTIARLYNDNISKARIPVPSLEKQEQIVAILDRFDALCNDLASGLPAEIEARRKQYEYYRDKLLTFQEA